jgi:hypothetical protein
MSDERNTFQQALFDCKGRRQQRRWLDAAARRDAEKTSWFARPAEEVAHDMGRLEDLLFTRARWKFASTMLDNPHSYTLRRKWDWPSGDDDFQWTVATIRVIGDREKFPPSGPYARWYTVLNIAGAKYWPMNYPINYPNGKPCTILINRKPAFLPGDRR